jgi:hypothetical protein
MSSTRSDALNPCAARTPSTRVARVRPTLEKLAFRGNRSPLTKSRLPPQAPSVESKGPIFDGTPKPLQNRRLTRRVFVQLPGPFSEPDPQFRDRLLDSEPLVSVERGKRRAHADVAGALLDGRAGDLTVQPHVGTYASPRNDKGMIGAFAFEAATDEERAVGQGCGE